MDSIEVISKHEDDGSPVSLKYCYSQCCKLGPALCQYMWIVWNSCFAVSCGTYPDECRPIPLESSHLYSIALSSLYVKITYITNSTSSENGERTLGAKATPKKNGGTVTSRKVEVDASPVAQAGEDVFVVLPQTSVWLYGNGSTANKVRRICTLLIEF